MLWLELSLVAQEDLGATPALTICFFSSLTLPCALSFSIAFLPREFGANLLQGRQKERVAWKNPSSAIYGGKTQK